MSYYLQHRGALAWTFGVITLSTLLLHLLIYLVPNDAPQVAVIVPLRYSLNGAVYGAGLISLLMTPLALVAWALVLAYPSLARPAAWVALIGAVAAFLGCVVAYWVGMFMFDSFTLVADVEFRENHYYLGRHVTDSDDPIVFYFAKCDPAQNSCVWRKIYEQFLITTEPATMGIDEANSRIVISMTDGPIYYYDGISGVCVTPTMGTCFTDDK